jgi:hypothetical protein
MRPVTHARNAGRAIFGSGDCPEGPRLFNEGTDDVSTLQHRYSAFAARFTDAGRRALGSCAIDVRADGTVVLVVDGEHLFHFKTLFELLEHYAPVPA